jgi:hypothetical protein
MAENKIYKGDVGTVFIVDVGESLADASVVKLYVAKPNGEAPEWAATKYGDTSLKYTAAQGDLDVAGLYKVQPYVEKPDWKGRGNTVSFTVHEYFK